MKIRVGIVGDGQLGMFLCEAAQALAIDTVILTGDAASPAAQRAGAAVVGTMDDAAAVEALADACDIVTYEREDVHPVAVEVLRRAQVAGSIHCHPSLDVIETIQDKARQKRWLADAGLPTLPFVLAHGEDGEAAAAASRLGFPLVQKALRGGFDGRGVQLLRDEAALARAWPGETLYEAHAGEFRELAVIVVRAQDGDLRCFPPVDMTFDSDYSVLEWVYAPSGAGECVLNEAERVARAAIEALNGVGTFGVELFHCADGRVLINEISPRVHNAGHYTLEGTESSQFEQHLRAVTGLPLASMELLTPAAMRNLLCNDAIVEAAGNRAAGRSVDGAVATYWYGKAPARAMRKLGHITATGATATEAGERAAAAYERLTGSHGEAA
ncbi:ATP-grasp domain-containing protein [Pseudohaliea rubra]|uniref:N5-carboxyaminoimidazole ribonucleotide synthase n=1 Tax=Pseudohaliea rubra DSM 19751 TaxID=1265313 RepID=A0A095XZE8_9GAMM|nr:ATP-grasp domain-containing protein [Pseudohaliea rubra]KGE05126.1 Phosphoribosylaminoimidazole carboxylase ATPase subunit [Pseudohaliea rubra DSM 19751]